MSRRAKFTSRRALPAILLAAAALAAPAAATAEPAAIDEYSLGPVGSRLAERDGPGKLPAAEETEPEPETGPGVVGETDPPESSLEALGAVASPSGWALIAVLLLGAGALLLSGRRSSAPR